MVGIVDPRLQKSAAGDETLLGSALRILKAPRISVLGRQLKKNTNCWTFVFRPFLIRRGNIFWGRKKLMENHLIALSQNNENERLFSNVFTFFLEHLLLNVQYSPVGCLKIFFIVCCRWERILSHSESLHSSWLWHAVVYVGRSRVASPTLNILTWWSSIVRFFPWRYPLNSISYMTNLTSLVSLMWSTSCLGLE